MEDGRQQYGYDAGGRQAWAQGSGYRLEQRYDGDGLRVKKNDNGDVVYYIRSSVLGGQVVAEIRNGGGSWIWSRGYVYWPGGELLAVQQGGVRWVHRDPVVKSQRLTDEAGNVVAVVELDPWGGETERSENPRYHPYVYGGYERDGNWSDQAQRRVKL